MKKLLMVIMLLFCCSRVVAGSFNEIIFFGDSLTDNGNLYKLLLKIIPKSPPYFKGRFSNGQVWAEGVGKYFYDKHYIDYHIYALGGATAVFHLPTSRFISPSNLELEVNNYLIDYFFRDKSQTLFSIWIGGNDYLYYQDWDPDGLTSKVVNKISWAIERLISNGAKHFLILNLPDLSKTPFARNYGSIPTLRLLTDLHNQKLSDAVDEIKKLNPDISFVKFDTHALFNDVIANPGKYNERYNAKISNISDSCWTGGYMFRDSFTKKDFNERVRKMILDNNNGTIPAHTDVETMSKFILGSPTIFHALTVGIWYDQGLTPCSNANEYLFWDEMHPTEVVHRVLAEIVIKQLTHELAAA